MYKRMVVMFSMFATSIVAMHDDEIVRYLAKSDEQFREWSSKMNKVQSALQQLVAQQEEKKTTEEQKTAKVEQSLGGSYMKVVD